MKKYTRKHGIIIASGILFTKTEKYSTTRWNIIKKSMIDLSNKYSIAIEENCANSIFIYDKINAVVNFDICNLEHTILPVFEGGDVIERIFAFIKETQFDKFETVSEDMLKIYVIHIWR